MASSISRLRCGVMGHKWVRVGGGEAPGNVVRCRRCGKQTEVTNRSIFNVGSGTAH